MSDNQTSSKMPSSLSPQTAQQTQRYTNPYQGFSASYQKKSPSKYNMITPARQTALKAQTFRQPDILPVSLQKKYIHFKPQQQHSPFQLITEVERFKLKTQYLQEQLAALQQENLEIKRQKKTLNQNYIQLINRDLENQQNYQNQLIQLKNQHQNQLTHFSKQLGLSAQEISKLQLELNNYRQQFEMSNTKFAQRQNYLLTTIKTLEEQLNYSKGECVHLTQKLNTYQDLIYKKQYQLEQVKLQLGIHLKNLQAKRTQHDSLLQQSHSLAQQNQSLKTQLDQLHTQLHHLNHELSLKQHSLSQLVEENSLLTKNSQKSLTQLTLQCQTIEQLTQKIHSLNLTHSELLTKTQQSTFLHKQQEQSLLNEINTLKFLESKLRQENHTLMKHIQNLKERQTLLIEEEKNAREKLASTMEKKNKQLEDLCQQNERLYKEINRVKFSSSSGSLAGGQSFGRS